MPVFFTKIFEAYFVKERLMRQLDIVLVQWAILARSCGSCAITRVALQNECGGYCSFSNRCVVKYMLSTHWNNVRWQTTALGENLLKLIFQA